MARREMEGGSGGLARGHHYLGVITDNVEVAGDTHWSGGDHRQGPHPSKIEIKLSLTTPVGRWWPLTRPQYP
ncbi:hypothetical protein CDL15_Pgr011284 [Punica granatum]|uniref:Uncharacterized protein n=1 Tax=Punica granatum TaxID=22663 RepID=A0A218WE91_PUNGR|nr:hypothetical protein CDL15_Pgr011284 [Punica granatum]